jgi:hypothetical protein
MMAMMETPLDLETLTQAVSIWVMMLPGTVTTIVAELQRTEARQIGHLRVAIVTLQVNITITIVRPRASMWFRKVQVMIAERRLAPMIAVQ